ncbi:MAG: dienelactone hydrolase family protein [Gemmatimonas sp.]
MIPLQIGATRAQAYVALPQGQDRAPGVVVTFHKNGIDDFTRWLVDELAREGFAAIAPDHFHVLPPGKGPDDRRDYMTDEHLVEDFRAAAEWLKSKNIVGKPALIGHCMGGRATLVGLVADPDLWSCGCMWYGGGVFRKMGKAPPPAELASALKVPVASFNGMEDTHPSPEEVGKLDARLTELGKPHDFHRYPGADHGFMNRFGDAYDPAAHKDSWTKAIAFMKRQIAVPQLS